MTRWRLSLAIHALALRFCYVVAVRSDAGYVKGQKLSIWANRIGPHYSPTETYGFYDALAWCKPSKLERRSLRFGEALSGDFLIKSLYQLSFNASQSNVLLCDANLSARDVDKFITAINQRYAYELLLDNLPMKLFVGETKGYPPAADFLYTHLDFLVFINNGNVVQASATPGSPVLLTPGRGTNIRFTYSVSWKTTLFPYARRAEKYRDPNHQRDREVHWFSIGNATLSVFLLMGLLGSILLRVVRRDFRDYEAMEADDDGEDFGWKQLQGDVFRFPRGLTLLCPFLGAGMQLLTLSSILLALGALEMFHPLSRGTIYTAAVCCYAATAGVAGFTSGFLYRQMGGTAWVRNALSTVAVFCGPVAIVWSGLHAVALAYNSTRAIPAWTVAVVFLLWAGVTIPLTIFGAILGKNQAKPFQAPVRTNKIPREIPPCPLYRSPLALAVISGLVPFSSIYLEMFFLFSAVWGHKVFQVYEMLAIVFVILIIVTLITTVSAVYFQLISENYLWMWSSLLYGGSVGFYIMAYSSFYYYVRSPLRGFMQASFFFGYMFLASYAFFLMCGTVGFFSARRFVNFLYSNVKSD